MNPRIAKEIRMQTPMLLFIAATAVAMAVIQMVRILQSTEYPDRFIAAPVILMGVYFLGSIVMTAAVFGNEFQYRTLSLLVSQPIERKKVWREKMIVLAAFSATVFLITLATVQFSFYLENVPDSVWNAPNHELSPFILMLLVPIIFFCTTPYLTLVSKSTIGGLVFAIFGAGVVLAAGDTLWGWRPGEVADDFRFLGFSWTEVSFCLALFLMYSALFYWLGYRKFMRMQVIDSQAMEASLPSVVEASLEKLSGKFTGRLPKLILKELRLQRLSFVMTAVFGLFIAFTAVAWKTKTITNQFYFDGAMWIYLFFFPALVGVTAVAEEKAWGLKDWHLTLPMSLGGQWRVKWMTALALGVALGALPIFWLTQGLPEKTELPISHVGLFLYCLLGTAVAMYAASISTSSVRALLITFGLMIGFALGMSLESSWFEQPNRLSEPISIILFIGFALNTWGLKLLWAIIVYPRWLLTHSVEKTRAVALWADESEGNHLRILMLALFAAGCFFFILRQARMNYRHSDLNQRRVWRQLLIIVVLGLLLGIEVLLMDHRYRVILN